MVEDKSRKVKFWVALMTTAIPIIVPSVVSVKLSMGGSFEGWFNATLVWSGATILSLMTLVVAIIITFKGGKGRIAAGIWAGIGIGVVSLLVAGITIWRA